MILNCQQLYMSTQNPRINMITLDLLREYYKTYLNPYIYEYKIINTEEEKMKEAIIELRFDKDNFCHLLGIESTLHYSVSYNELQKYKSKLGWNNIKNGVLDFKFLKAKNRRGFYIPKTFLIEKITANNHGLKYIGNQQKITVKKISRNVISRD